MRLSLAVVLILVLQSVVGSAGAQYLCPTHTPVAAEDSCCSQEPMDDDCCCRLDILPETPEDNAVSASTLTVQLPATAGRAYSPALPVTDGSTRPADVDQAVPHLFLQSTGIERGPPAQAPSAVPPVRLPFDDGNVPRPHFAVHNERTHDLEQAARCGRVIELRDGKRLGEQPRRTLSACSR